MFPGTITSSFAFLCLTMFMQQSHCLDALAAYKEIEKIVSLCTAPRGDAFPTISSPRSTDEKIAIVGAGPAGIHMAYLLKKKGFKNIVVYEKTGRIGGKSLTVEHRSTLHEMGTCYVQPDYEENVVALAKEYGLWDPVALPSANIWLDHYQTSTEYKTYVIGEIMKMLMTNNITKAQTALFKAMVEYCIIHRNLFGKYEGELMRQPGRETMETLRCTFEEFLKKKNLLALKPIFLASHTVQGYGHLDEMSALYGLMWNTPNYIKGLAGKLIGVSHGLNMIRGGFENLWKTIVQRENIKVVLNANISKVKRSENGVSLRVGHGDRNRRRKRTKYDFLIWTPSVYTTRDLLDANREEKTIFQKLTPVWFTTTLFDSTYGNRGNSPIDYWLSNVENKREHHLWAQRDSFGTLHSYYGKAYQNGSLPGGPDGKFIRSGVAYQYGKSKPRSKQWLEVELRRNLGATGASNIQIIRQEIWEYFPKFSPDDMADGVLWDIFKMQGRRRTWFAGSSVNFESVKSVLEYNKLLVSKMKYSTV